MVVGVLGRAGVGVAKRLPPGARRAINTARGIETPHLVRSLDTRRPVVLAPHPDDELIGAGGVLAAHVAAGLDPAVIHLTSGERTAGLAKLPAAERKPRREAEALDAAAVIGVAADRVEFLRLPDGGLDPDDDTQVAALTRAIVALEPDLIYAPWPLDAHRDHTAATALLARVLSDHSPAPRVALYEVWNPLTPTHLVDIGDHIDTKLDALDRYESALASVDYRHTARGLAAYRSAQGLSGRGYAEAFVVLSVDALGELVSSIDR